MRNKLFILLLILISTSCFITLLRATFQQGEYNIQQHMKYALQETITKDYYKRFFQKSIHIPEPLRRKVKGIKAATEKGNENIIFKDSIDELIAMQLVNQYMLEKITPIVPNDFNMIYKEELAKQGLTDKTGIIYRHNGIPQYSDNDSISPHSALCTHIKMLDIKNTVSVQGWIDYSWKTLLKHTNTKNLWIILVCYIASLTVILYKKKETKRLKNPTIEKDLGYCEAGKIKLDLNRKLLYIDGTECSINNMDFDLLRMFLEVPDHYLSRENIKKAFWPKEDNSDDKINSHISSLRRILKKIEGYELVTIKGKGYSLSISS